MNTLTIYTDGACSGNPGPGGWCAILLYGDKQKVVSGGHEETTNNRMELQAVIKGLEAITRPCDTVVCSDSAYIVNMVNGGYLDSWQRNGWKTSQKSAVKNRDLWETLSSLLATKCSSFKFQKVSGHSGVEWNEKCDEEARKQRDLYRWRTYECV